MYGTFSSQTSSVYYQELLATCPTRYILSYRCPAKSSSTPAVAPLVFFMNSRFDILFFTCGLVRSTDSKINEKHRTYTASEKIRSIEDTDTKRIIVWGTPCFLHSLQRTFCKCNYCIVVKLATRNWWISLVDQTGLYIPYYFYGISVTTLSIQTFLKYQHELQFVTEI